MSMSNLLANAIKPVPKAKFETPRLTAAKRLALTPKILLLNPQSPNLPAPHPARKAMSMSNLLANAIKPVPKAKSVTPRPIAARKTKVKTTTAQITM